MVGRRLDAHIHLFERGIHADTLVDAELREYNELRKKYKIAVALVVGYEGTPEHMGNNAYLERLALSHRWIAPVRFAAPGADVEVLGDGFVGHSIYLADWPSDSLDASGSFRTMREASVTARRRRPIVSINSTQEAIEEHRGALAQFEGCTIMVSHLGLPGRPAPDGHTARARLRPLFELAEEVDLVVKLSALYATDPDPSGSGAAPYASELLEALGAERLVWGSDFSPVADASGLEDGFTLRPAVAALFEARDLDGLFGENLSAILDSAGFSRYNDEEAGAL